MASFRELLRATDAELVKIFYKLKPSGEDDFIRKINFAARQVGLNHAQLVCALGFNQHIHELTDILSQVGFSSYKLLSYRRNELFSTDTYRQLDIDNVLDIYAAQLEDADFEATLRELVPQRLGNIEAQLDAGDDPAMTISYKMEVHSIYTSGVATAEFAQSRVSAPIAGHREVADEVQMIIDAALIPPNNLFYSDDLLPTEKQVLIDGGHIGIDLINNRLQNPEISEDERQMLEDYL